MSLDLKTTEMSSCATDCNLDETVRLGMPHLTACGLSMNWVLRECCHRQWWQIARHLDTDPARLTDLAGARMMASVVDVSVRGSLSAFREDDLLRIEPLVLADPATGWRAKWMIRSAAGASAMVELVTAFAKRTSDSNSSLSPAMLPAELKADRSAPSSSGARRLRARGKSIRAAAPGENAAPLFSFEVFGPSHFNGVGLVYFANFVDFFERAESLAIPDPMRTLTVTARSLHYFGNADHGDWIDIECGDTSCALTEGTELTSFSVARRRSDGVVIAACMTSRGVSGKA
ncbi:hypothetical protein LVO79_07290 [Roseivivax marinus]|uniref:Pnap_2097 family protein n=1 Tax=Roseivivax marinus TaxID=1379903 RepID=UPI001F03A3F1|nr:Pnap_2097 family protein [Roseivivax marinus]UMA66240.1 hypothetical protein LVO79_07290 [Roseivivax marinus]